jgi:hypothetical protein
VTTVTAAIPAQRRGHNKSDIIDELLEIHKDGWHLTRTQLEKMTKPRLARLLQLARRHCR